MKVVVLSTEFPPGPGGIGTHAYHVCAQLVRRGWQVRVVTPQHYAEAAAVEAFNRSAPFPVVHLGERTGVRSLVARLGLVERTLVTFRPDVILATGDTAIYIAAAVAPLHRVPCVAVEHGRHPGGWEAPIKRTSFGCARTLIAVSQYSGDALRAYGVRPRRMEIIHNGADETAYYPSSAEEVRDWRARVGIPVGARVVVTVGHVSERKGQDVVVRALAELGPGFEDVHYVCVGLPSHAQTVGELAASLGVGERVHLTGRLPLEGVRALLTGADSFAMTSRHALGQFEGFGIAVIEAALCGAPAVVSGESGLAEAVVEGDTGFLVPENDPRATAAALARLLGDRALRERMGQAARRRALDGYTWDRVGERYDDVLRSSCT